MLGPVLVCHQKDENAVKLLRDTLLDAFPGLEENIKVLGADGENSIVNQACNAFSVCNAISMYQAYRRKH